jgi:hypothetical protein
MREKFAFRHHAQGTAPVAERNQPIPDITIFRMHSNANFVAVKIRRRDMIFDVSEERTAHRKVRRLVQLKQARQHPTETTSVEDKPGVDGILLALGASHSNAWTSALEIYRQHFVPVTYFDSLPLDFQRQYMIEAGARHLVGGPPTVGILVAKIEFGVLLAAREGGAVLYLKTGVVHGLEHAGLFEILHALRQQAFADAKTRKLFPFKHQDLYSAPLQQGAGKGTRRSGADDQNFHSHFRL